MKYALKEWDTTIESLGQGKIIAIWRKGGLNENFTVEQKKFILFPTFNHESKDKIKEYFLSPQTQDFGPNKDNQIKIKYFAEVHETLTVNTFEELLRISSELIHTEDHLRYLWDLSGNEQGKILLLRVYILCNPILIKNSPEYSGCKSWTRLSVDIPKTGSKAVLSFKDFQYKVRLFHRLLDEVKESIPIETLHEKSLLSTVKP